MELILFDNLWWKISALLSYELTHCVWPEANFVSWRTVKHVNWMLAIEILMYKTMARCWLWSEIFRSSRRWRISCVLCRKCTAACRNRPWTDLSWQAMRQIATRRPAPRWTLSYGRLTFWRSASNDEQIPRIGSLRRCRLWRILVFLCFHNFFGTRWREFFDEAAVLRHHLCI